MPQVGDVALVDGEEDVAGLEASGVAGGAVVHLKNGLEVAYYFQGEIQERFSEERAKVLEIVVSYSGIFRYSWLPVHLRCWKKIVFGTCS